jgi:hypothetical protein
MSKRRIAGDGACGPQTNFCNLSSPYGSSSFPGALRSAARERLAEWNCVAPLGLNFFHRLRRTYMNAAVFVDHHPFSLRRFAVLRVSLRQSGEELFFCLPGIYASARATRFDNMPGYYRPSR